MRKHSVRKFIHAVLDCLPLLVIPIFAIYSQNHEINDNTLQVQENKVVDFNQVFIDGNFTDRNNWGSNGTLTFNDNVATFLADNQNDYMHKECERVLNHYFLLSVQIKTSSLTNKVYISRGGSPLYACSESLDWQLLQYKYQSTTSSNGYYGIIDTRANGWDYIYVQNYQVFDLTQMFGEGNEPTIEQFNTYFPNSYYSYTESEEVVIENYETITYNDTDIMSQFMYVTYNAVDKYFNMNKVFNLGNIWTWVNNTLFGGQAPISAFIVYNVIAYEFIMDIIFLIYLVLMWLIDWIECCIDRFLKKAS